MPTIGARSRVSFQNVRDPVPEGLWFPYVPNKSAYGPKDMRKKLFQEGKRFDKELAAGTYARQFVSAF